MPDGVKVGKKAKVSSAKQSKPPKAKTTSAKKGKQDQGYTLVGPILPRSIYDQDYANVNQATVFRHQQTGQLFGWLSETVVNQHFIKDTRNRAQEVARADLPWGWCRYEVERWLTQTDTRIKTPVKDNLHLLAPFYDHFDLDDPSKSPKAVRLAKIALTKHAAAFTRFLNENPEARPPVSYDNDPKYTLPNAPASSEHSALISEDASLDDPTKSGGAGPLEVQSNGSGNVPQLGLIRNPGSTQRILAAISNDTGNIMDPSANGTLGSSNGKKKLVSGTSNHATRQPKKRKNDQKRTADQAKKRREGGYGASKNQPIILDE